MIHVILICFNNPGQTRTRYERDLRPALDAARAEWGYDHFVTIVDNSAERSDSLQGFFESSYHWNRGENLQYGPSINYAVRCGYPSAFVLYCCTRHGRALDPAWACDLFRPMVADPAVGLTGCLWGSNSPGGVAHATGQEWVKERYRFTDDRGDGYVPQHIQGGVWAARTELLLRFPYYPAIPHLYTDHTLTWDAMLAGYRVVDVPSVRSVWRDVYPAHKMDGVKYLHDEAHT